MSTSDAREAVRVAAELAGDFLDGLPHRRVGPAAPVDELRRALGGPLPARGEDPVEVLRGLAAAAEPGLVGNAGPRYFGFVTGGALPAAVGADVLAAAWDQNAFTPLAAPAAVVAEEVVGGWLRDLLGLPGHASFALVTGAQQANTTALAAARHHVLAAVGWDVENDGLLAAPPVRVVVGAERHVTVDRALRVLGLGAGRAELVPTDGQGALRADALAGALAAGPPGPAIVCTQAGNVNTGAFDEHAGICAVARAHGPDTWVHVDGAFGLWAAADPARRGLVDGIAGADSWTTDGHKWLNVGYDCGLVFCARPDAHRAAMGAQASYLMRDPNGPRDPLDWGPEASRRARGFAVYAALRSLGREGVAGLVSRCCALAARFAEALAAMPEVEIVNDVVLNQVLVSFGSDQRTRAVLDGVQRDGTCWLGGTRWRGRELMRISVCNWSTTAADVDRSVAAIGRALVSP